MKTAFIALCLLGATLCGQAAATVNQKNAQIGQPTIFWRNGQWETRQAGKWTTYSQVCAQSSREADHSSIVCSPAVSGPVSCNEVDAKCADGNNQPNIGIGINNFRISRRGIGIGRPNGGIGQTTIGIGQPNFTIGQTTIGIGQTTIGIGKPMQFPGAQCRR